MSAALHTSMQSDKQVHVYGHIVLYFRMELKLLLFRYNLMELAALSGAVDKQANVFVNSPSRTSRVIITHYNRQRPVERSILHYIVI